MMSGVGIDVSKAWLDVAWSACDRRLRVANTSVGWKVLVQAMADDPHVRIVLEASGGYEQGLLDYLVQAGHWVCRINPRQARDFAKALGRQMMKSGATDDARIEYGFRRCFSRPPSAEERQRLSELIQQQRSEFSNDSEAWTTVARVLLNLDELITRD